MKDKTNRITLYFFALILVLIATSAGNIGNPQGPVSPITMEFNASEIPVLGEDSEIFCRISSILDAPNTSASITLPSGVLLTAGNLTGRWDLKANEPVFLNITVRFTEAGDFKLEAEAHHAVNEGSSWGDQKAIYLTIGQERSLFTPAPIYAEPAAGGREPAIGNSMQFNQTEMRLNKFNDVTAENISSNKPENRSIKMPAGPTSPGYLTLHGYWHYFTEPGDVRVNPTTEVPGADFYVRVIDGNSNFLGDTYTDVNGYWSVTVINPSPAGVQILFYTYDKWNYNNLAYPELRVVSSSSAGLTGLNYVYYWYTSVYILTDGSYDMGTYSAPSTSINLKACWLLNDLNRAWLFMYNNGGRNAGQGTILWYPSSTDGTYYNLGGMTHITNVDAQSADISIHEYGHNVMWNAYGQWWPPENCPSPHYMETNEDIVCAWTEGWADFLSLPVNGNAIWSWSKTSYENLETQTWGTPGWDNGPGVEGRVAGALWDIYDTQNDGSDQYSFPFSYIENIFWNKRDSKFLDFWNDWLAYAYSTNAWRCIYQNTIDFSTSWRSGRTTPGATNWQAFGSKAIYVDVNTAAAGFTATPRYFTSLGGNGYQYNAVGVSAIYSPTSTGFRVYLQNRDGSALTPAFANSKGWYMQWLGVPAANTNSGSTTSGATNWQAFGSNAIYVDVNTAAAGFTATPRYFTSLGGNGYQYNAVGVNAIYSPTSTGFRVYVQNRDGSALTPAFANSKGWYLRWLGVPAATTNSGSTTPGATAWQAFGSNAIYVDINTAASGFATTPLFFTSLGGNGYQYNAVGVNAIYSPTSTGFRVYVQNRDGSALTPALANSRGWYMQRLGA